MDLEVLSVKEDLNNKDLWNVVGIVGYNSFAAQLSQAILKASKNTIALVLDFLDKGLSIYISKNTNGIEVMPSDLIINENDDFSCTKNIILKSLYNLINLNLLGIDVIDAMDYLNCYMKLLAAGIFITDRNREDKYFEIIEAAQENEMPAELSTDCTFELEQEYIEKKKLYETSQENLNTLEKYLNAYDKLAKINFTNTFLNEVKENIQNAESIEELNDLYNKYKELIKEYLTV